MMLETSAKLTPEQIKNWRMAMVGMFGGYALIMPEEEIQQFRDRLQQVVNEVDEPPDQRKDGE